jgi:tetratricopeptide (TPR) repeat protein
MPWTRQLVSMILLALLAGIARADDAQDAVKRYQEGKEAFDKKDWDKAIERFTDALKLDPKHADSYFYRGRANQNKNYAEKAIQDFTEALRLDPNRADCHYYRALVLQGAKEWDRALEDLTEAIKLHPTTDAHINRGYLYHEIKKNYEQAILDYTEAMRLDPKAFTAANNLAWMKATCSDAKLRDGKSAVELARKACEGTEWKNALFLDTLAAAYAENNQFGEAAKWQAKALETPNVFPKEELEKAKDRLKLYKERKPYRVE